MIQYKSVYITFNQRRTTAVVHVSTKNIDVNGGGGGGGGGALDVKPFPLPQIPVPERYVPKSQTYRRSRGESREMFSHRVSINSRAATSRLLRLQTTALLRSEMAKRGKSQSEITRLVLHMERLTKDLTRFGFPGPMAPIDGGKIPTVQDLMEQFQLIPELAGIDAREPTPEETVDFLGSDMAENALKTIDYSDDIILNSPQPVTSLGRRGYDDLDEDEDMTTRRTRPRDDDEYLFTEAYSINGRYEDNEEKVKEFLKRSKQKLKASRILRLSAGAPQIIQKNNVENEMPDSQYTDLLDNITKEQQNIRTDIPEGVDIAAVQKNAFKKISSRYPSSLSFSALTRMTPIKQERIKRYLMAPLVLAGVWGTWQFYTVFSEDAVTKLLRSIDESKKKLVNIREHIEKAGTHVEDNKGLLATLETESKNVHMKLLAILKGGNIEVIETELQKLEELMDKTGGYISKAVPLLKVKDAELAKELADSWDQTYSQVFSVKKLVVGTLTDQQSTLETAFKLTDTIEDATSQMRKNYRHIELSIASAQSDIKIADTLLANQRTIAEVSIRSIGWADQFENLIMSVVGFADPIARFFIKATIGGLMAPFRAAEAEIFARYGVTDEVLQLSIRDYLWKTAEIAADQWTAFTQLSVYQWFAHLKPNPIPEILKQRQEERAMGDTIKIALWDMWAFPSQGAERRAEAGNAQWGLTASVLHKLQAISVVPYLQSAGWAFSMAANMWAFRSITNQAWAYTLSTYTSMVVPLAITFSVPLLASFFGYRNLGDILKDAAIRGEGVTAGVAKTLRTVLAPTEPQRALGWAMEYYTSLMKGELRGVGGMFMSYIAIAMLVPAMKPFYGAEALNMMFHLIQSEQLGEYVVGFSRLIKVENECFQQADDAYDEANDRAQQTDRKLTYNQLLAVQERVLDDCRRKLRREIELGGQGVSKVFWEEIGRYKEKWKQHTETGREQKQKKKK